MSNDPESRPRQIPPAQLTAARLLLRSCRAATLATVQDEQPHAALVTPACAADGAVLLLLSELSRHTRQLRQHPRCALLCTGSAMPAANPQQWARLSLACTAAVDMAPTSRARFLALHPEAALYADFQDFRIWRLWPHEAQFVAGFGQAWTVPGEAFLPPAVDVQCATLAEGDAMALCNENQATLLAQIGQAHTGIPGDWNLVGLDPDGCHLSGPAGIVHIGWPGDVAAGLQDRIGALAKAGQTAER